MLPLYEGVLWFCLEDMWYRLYVGMIQAPKTCSEAVRKYWFGLEKMWYLVPKYIIPLGTWKILSFKSIGSSAPKYPKLAPEIFVWFSSTALIQLTKLFVQYRNETEVFWDGIFLVSVCSDQCELGLPVPLKFLFGMLSTSVDS